MMFFLTSLVYFSIYNSIVGTVIFRYYDMLEEVMDECGVRNNPTAIYNCDETGLPLDYVPQKVVAGKGEKAVYAVTSGSKTKVTLMGCGNAAGQMVSPMIVHSGKRTNTELETTAPEGWHVVFTQNGWMTAEAFLYWLKEVCK